MKRFFFNYKVDKYELTRFFSWFIQAYGSAKTTQFADTLKYVGFHYAMRAGISIGIEDLQIPPAKYTLVENAKTTLLQTTLSCERGETTAIEEFEKVIDTWAWTSENVKKQVVNHFEVYQPTNPVYMMAFSGARGNISQVRQLVGMRGLMANPKGDLIALPIQTNLRDRLTVVEYIISCYGARKGIVDTALRTANSGYLTRRLIEVAQDVSICTVTCATPHGVPVRALYDHNTPLKKRHLKKPMTPLSKKLIGRVLAETVHPAYARKGQDMTPLLALSIAKVFSSVFIRSPFTCNTTYIDDQIRYGARSQICQYCYGWNLADYNLVSIGEAVGVIAAQSIGEPGTQLTMRTFHTGGVFSGNVVDKLVAPHAGQISFAQVAHLNSEGNLIKPTLLSGRPIRTQQGEWAFCTFTPTWVAISGVKTTILTFPPCSLIFPPPGGYVGENQIIGELTALGTREDLQISLKRSNQGIEDTVEEGVNELGSLSVVAEPAKFILKISTFLHHPMQ